jgi:vitamin K-dependent gamma-carboxylase
LLFVKLELAIVYTFAGICKVNVDWLRGQPLRQWLTDKDKIPLVGPFLVLEPTAYFMSWGGMVYDLIVAELLFFRATKWLGLAASIFFHISNKLTFDIGIFPWMMLASTTFYLRPDWPRLVFHRLTGKSMETYRYFRQKTFAEVGPKSLSLGQKLLLLILVIFLVHQLLTPLRLHTYPGEVAWNEYGHQFSWRMKLRTKKCDSAVFAYNPEAHQGFEIPIERFLNTRQYRKMSSRPDMVFQFAEFVGSHFDEQFQVLNVTAPTEVYMEVCVF